MRTGEIIALKWENIDFKNWIIKVRLSIRDGRFTAPKTKSNIRDIEVIDALKSYLLEHRKMSDEDSVFVFETVKGEPFCRSDKISSHYWKKISRIEIFIR